MEPLDRNFAYLLFFNYGVRKLTKKQQKKRASSTQMNGAMFEKSVFFSPKKEHTKTFLEFLHELVD